MVHELTGLGHRVLGCARTTSDIERLRLTYPAQDFCSVDVSHDSEVKTWALCLFEKYGSPDLVINNAAVLNEKAPLWNIPEQDFNNLLATNITGMVNMIRHFAPLMIERRQGKFINVASRWARKIEVGIGPYCSSKCAVVILTKVLAEELRPTNVVAVALNPGIINTQMLQLYLGRGTPQEPKCYPSPAAWATTAIPFILGLGLKDTGKLRSLPRGGIL
jgi:NAD(P)-dependent dehydrogenase (short-subunit alcohol dehydrogenase family)